MSESELISELKKRGCDKIIDWRDRSRFPLQDIECGIVFVIACWSGQAKVGLYALANAIGKCQSKPTLFLVDNDQIDEPWMSSFFHHDKGTSALHGFGECLFIKGGTVQRSMTRLYDVTEEQLIESIKELRIV